MAFYCPHCGKEFDRDRQSCPYCGSDENTGWSESMEHMLPDEDDEISPEEVSKGQWVKGVAAGLLALVLLWAWTRT